MHRNSNSEAQFRTGTEIVPLMKINREKTEKITKEKKIDCTGRTAD